MVIIGQEGQEDVEKMIDTTGFIMKLKSKPTKYGNPIRAKI
jgi:hypothetical protein